MLACLAVLTIIGTALIPSFAASNEVNALNTVAPWFRAALAPQQVSGVETITTYKADCVTPSTEFNLGDTVCAKVDNAPIFALIPDLVLRRVNWVNTSGFILQQSNVEGPSGQFTFTIPSTAISPEGIDRRGGWSVNIISSSDSSVRAQALFTVKDPEEDAANVMVYQTVDRGDAVIGAGENLTLRVTVFNRGPNAAQNVQLNEGNPVLSDGSLTPPSFASHAQLSGEPCVFSGDTTCTIESLPVGGVATFTFNFQVDSGTPSFTGVSTTATITSQTIDPRSSDNSSTAYSVIVGEAIAADCTLTAPANIVTTANTVQNGQPGAIVNYSAGGVAGNCGAVSNSPASGSFFTVGTHTVTSTSELGGGSTSFTIKVVDTAAPTISCPVNLTVNAGAGSNEATVNVGTPTFTASGGGTIVGVRSDSISAVYDDDGNLITPAVTKALTDPYPAGSTGIVWTVTDADGRTVSCSQKVTVISDACSTDTEAPTITAPADITIGTGAGNPGCTVALDDELGQADVNDNCTVSVTISGLPAGNAFAPGTYTLTYTATDGAGHTASDTQVVTVVDDSAPSIEAPADATYVCASEVPAANASQAVRGEVLDENGNPLPPGPPFDNCGTPLVTVSETNNGGAGSAASPLVITRTFQATDSAGNSSTDTQTITVIDAVPPTITAPPDVTAYTGANATTCDAVVANLGTATGDDNCSVSITRSPTGNTFPVGTTNVVWTATDSAGNTTTATQKVTVIDDTPPVVTLNGANPLVVIQGDPFVDPSASASDACAGSLPVSVSGTVDTNVIGTYTITYSATDGANNTGSATRTVKVIYRFTGFFSPVSNLPVINVVNAGRSVPIKFNLNGNQGLNIFEAGYPVSQQVNCNTSAPLQNVESTSTAGSSSLSYDAATGQYSYVWKTESSWVGQCRLLNVRLNDGTDHQLMLKFK